MHSAFHSIALAPTHRLLRESSSRSLSESRFGVLYHLVTAAKVKYLDICPMSMIHRAGTECCASTLLSSFSTDTSVQAPGLLGDTAAL